MIPDPRHPYIVETPGTLGGKPRIDGLRMSVQHIAIDYEKLGMTPDEICDAYPPLTLSQVHGALAYFYDHRDEVLARFEAGKKFAEEYRLQHPDRVN